MYVNLTLTCHEYFILGLIKSVVHYRLVFLFIIRSNCGQVKIVGGQVNFSATCPRGQVTKIVNVEP